MKKITLFALALSCYFSTVSAAETKLFTGDVAPSLFSRMDMVAWAMGEIKDNARYANFGTDAAPAFARVTDNPVKTGLNASEKALQLSSLKGKSWWPDFLNLDLTAPITITAENRYLHIMHFRENLNKGFSVSINATTALEGTDVGTKRFDMNLTKAGQWEDVVIDLKWFIDNNVPLSSICVLIDMNWGGDAEPATNYYFDEISLSNDNMPRGITILSDTEMSLFFGNTTSYNKWVSKLDMQNAENTSEIVANPFTTETAVLNSTSILKFNKSANASWWQGPRVVFPGILEVGKAGASSYLHVMVNIPTMEAGKDFYTVQLNAKDFSGKQLESGDALKYWADDKGKWIDMVFDVTTLGYVQEFTVRFDVRRDAADALINSPAGEFYMDAAAINTSEAQRTAVLAPTSVKTVADNGVNVFVKNKSINISGAATQISIYTVDGKRVNQINEVKMNHSIPMAFAGVYMVKTINAQGKAATSKVVVY